VSFEPDSARRVYEGRLIGLTVERWGDHEREIVEHPGAVAIVAVDAEGFVTLVRQLREPARKRLLELPAGTAEPGEEPLETARRELREECGLTGGEWRELAVFWTTPGFCRERMHLFAAEGVERGEASPAADEELELVRWPVADAGKCLHEIEDAKTLAGLLLYLRTLAAQTGSP
jgi:ADP-ribose pyrophosphatase